MSEINPDLVRDFKSQQETYEEQPEKSNEQLLLEEFTRTSHVFTPSLILPFLQQKGMLKNTLRKNLEGLVEASAKIYGYNNEPHLINTHKGVLNIATNEIEHRNNRLFDRIIPNYDPTAKAPAFKKLLNNYNTTEYPDLSEDLLKMFAYQLFGNNKLKTFFIIYGNGDNAKSTLWNLVENALGNQNENGYASKVNNKTFIDDGKNFNVGLMELDNSRFIFADEVKGNVELDGTLIKQLVAGVGSTVQFEAKGGKKQINAKIISPVVLLVNELPDFKNADQATINRIATVEFAKKFVRGDSDAEKLIEDAMNEQAGIFNLILQAYDPNWTIPVRWRDDATDIVDNQVHDDDALYHLEQALNETVEFTHDSQDKVRRAELHADLRTKYYNNAEEKLPTSRELQVLLTSNFDIGVSGNQYTRILIK